MADVSICVAGGGIGGVAAAVALSQVGVRAEVYERAAALSEVGSGLSLWPNGTRALRQLGVLEEVLARSGVSNRFLVRRNDGRVLMELGIGASDVQVPEARLYLLTAFVVKPLSTPPKT